MKRYTDVYDSYRRDWDLFKVLLGINLLLLKILCVGVHLVMAMH